MNLKDSLCAVELFCELPPDLVEEMIARGSTVEVGAAVPFVRQGEVGGGMLMLIRGTAEVLVDDQPVRTLSTGDYFGEMSLIDGAARSATVTSGSDGATAFRLSQAAFNDLLAKHPHTAVLLLRGLVTRVRELEAHVGEATRG